MYSLDRPTALPTKLPVALVGPLDARMMDCRAIVAALKELATDASEPRAAEEEAIDDDDDEDEPDARCLGDAIDGSLSSRVCAASWCAARRIVVT